MPLTATERHKKHLEWLCFICRNKVAIQTRQFTASSASEGITATLGAEVTAETGLDHSPDYLCSRCYQTVYLDFAKVKRLKGQRKKDSIEKLKPEISNVYKGTWKPHSSECDICHSVDDYASDTEASPAKPSPFRHKRVKTREAEVLDENRPGKKIKKRLSDFIAEGETSGTTITKEYTLESDAKSFPTQAFLNSKLAEVFQCNLCNFVPIELVVTNCKCFYCKKCIEQQLEKKTSAKCIKCLTPLLPKDHCDIMDSSVEKATKDSYQALQVKCKHDCGRTYKMSGIHLHQSKCDKQERHATETRGRKKKLLVDIPEQFNQRKRVQPLAEQYEKLCLSNDEVPLDMAFAMMVEQLEGEQYKLEKDILRGVWFSYFGKNIESGFDPKKTQRLTPNEVVKLKIIMRLSTRQIESDFLPLMQEYGIGNMFPKRTAIRTAWLSHMPAGATFTVSNPQTGEIIQSWQPPADQQDLKQMSVYSASSNIPKWPGYSIHPQSIDSQIPVIMGIAKHIEELFDNGDLPQGDQECTYQLFLVYCVDGVGEVPAMLDKSLRALPNKALRAAFCLFKVEDGDGNVIYRNTKPNSHFSCRTYLVARLNESDTNSYVLATSKSENDFDILRHNTLKVRNVSFIKSQIFFTPDIKLKSIASGGASTASTYGFCDSGTATATTAKSNPGTCKMEKTLALSAKMARLVLSNPKGKSGESLFKDSQGMIHPSLTRTDVEFRPYDTLHFDINLFHFFQKLLKKCLFFVYEQNLEDTEKVWEDREKHAHANDHIENLLKTHLKTSLAIDPSPNSRKPGNDSRKFFDPENREIIDASFELLNSLTEAQMQKKEELKRKFGETLQAFQKVRSIYKFQKFHSEQIPSGDQLKAACQEFGAILFSNFPFAPCTVTLHAILDHAHIWTPELASMSSEPLESGHKQFRDILLHRSFQGDANRSLQDALVYQYISSSPLLHKQ